LSEATVGHGGVLRSLSAEELRWKEDNRRLYQQLAARCRASTFPESFPLSELKKRHG
jgi:hypothetical protein